ncbi:MAG: hypothetical protein ACOC8X_09450, partial [Chloroflexota bacterium]
MHIRTTADNPLSLPSDASFARALRWFLVPPMTTLALLILAGAFIIASYESRHDGLIYSGVQVAGVDVSQMAPDEAQGILAGYFPQSAERTVVLRDPGSEQEWTYSLVELGIR